MWKLHYTQFETQLVNWSSTADPLHLWVLLCALTEGKLQSMNLAFTPYTKLNKTKISPKRSFQPNSQCFTKGKVKITTRMYTRTIRTPTRRQSNKNEFLLRAWHCQLFIPTRKFQHFIKFRKLPERDSGPQKGGKIEKKYYFQLKYFSGLKFIIYKF